MLLLSLISLVIALVLSVRERRLNSAAMDGLLHSLRNLRDKSREYFDPNGEV